MFHSCVCYNKEILSNINKKDLTGKRFCKLIVLKENEKRTDNGKITWLCKCDCGTMVSVPTNSLTSGNTSSCGCIGKSKGEFFIEKLLNENNILFIREYPIIINNKRLRYDFAILENNSVKYLIEFDGEQHFKEIEYFGGKQQLDKTKENDEIKNQWAKKNNIPLIRIPYNHLNNLQLKDLLLNTTTFLYQ